MSVVFRFSTDGAADGISFELEGSEDFVRDHLAFLAPFLRRAGGGVAGASAVARTGAGATAGDGTPSSGIEGVAVWWERSVLAGTQPSLQDTMLLFAYYMRSYRKTVFVSEDIRRCFQVLGVEEPRSLLQILGTLKREHGLLLNAGRRGEYMMNTTGIARARELLGERRPGTGAPAGDAAPPVPLKGKLTDALNIFTD